MFEQGFMHIAYDYRFQLTQKQTFLSFVPYSRPTFCKEVHINWDGFYFVNFNRMDFTIDSYLCNQEVYSYNRIWSFVTLWTLLTKADQLLILSLSLMWNSQCEINIFFRRCFYGKILFKTNPQSTVIIRMFRWIKKILDAWVAIFWVRSKSCSFLLETSPSTWNLQFVSSILHTEIWVTNKIVVEK